MVPKEDLQKIIILEHLTDDMLTKLVPFINLLNFKDKDIIFDENSDADRFYMLKRGKILLEKQISSKITVSLGSIKPGYSFGWSAIFGKPFSMRAVCAENSEVFSAGKDNILDLLAADHSMGFTVMQSLNRMMKNRLDRMEEQFLRAVREHPDFRPLLEN